MTEHPITNDEIDRLATYVINSRPVVASVAEILSLIELIKAIRTRPMPQPEDEVSCSV